MPPGGLLNLTMTHKIKLYDWQLVSKLKLMFEQIFFYADYPLRGCS